MFNLIFLFKNNKMMKKIIYLLFILFNKQKSIILGKNIISFLNEYLNNN